MDDTEPLDPGPPARLARPVTLRALLVAVALTALLSIVAGVLISSVVVGHGLPGPRGQPGPTGAAGSAGRRGAAGDSATVDPEAVYSAIEDDPARVAQAVSGELDAAPASDLEDVRATADGVRNDLDGLCGQLRLAQALSDVLVSC